jgi:hypothetical protein
LPDGSRFYPAPGRLRNPNLSSIRTKLNDGRADYHGLAVEVRRRLDDGLQLQASFNWSKSLDDGAGAGGSGDFENETGMARELFVKDRGPSAWDTTRSLVASVVYPLPLGQGQRWLGEASGIGRVLLSNWQIASMVQVSDGNPFSAILGYIPAGFIAGGGDQTYYPNLTPGASNNPVVGGPDRYFDASVFQLPAAGRVGDLGRNTLIGPGLATVDLSLTKNNPVGEGKNVQVRIEAFNILNRSNFGVPQRNIFSLGSTVPRADAGRITQTSTTARQLQVGVRFTF